MLRFLQQLPRALRQQWYLSVRTSQAVQSEQDGLDNATRVHSASEKCENERICQDQATVNSCLSNKDDQPSTKDDQQLQSCILKKYYHHTYSQLPYTCREALGWGGALVVGLQILHLWKSGWFGKGGSKENVQRKRDRECLAKSLYQLAMAMPQSSVVRHYCIQQDGKDHSEKAKDVDKITNKETDDNRVPSFEEAVDSWKRFSNKYVAMTLTLEGVEHAKQGSFAKAIGLWERASKAGLDKAHYNLAICYENGHGVEKNMHKAVEHYEEAAKRGHPEGLFNLAMIHLGEEETITQDQDLAVHLLQQAASQGLPQAQRELGVLYTKEEMKDMKRACELFEDAVSQEDIDAMYFLGICYEEGWGTEKNECKAAELYTKASRAGHEGALYNLATFFEDGKGGLPEDKCTAVELFQQAWKNGNPWAKAEICRLNSLLLNRKLGDEMDASGDKATGQSLSQPVFGESINRNLNLLFDEDSRNMAKRSFVESEAGCCDDGSANEKATRPAVQFYVGEDVEESVHVQQDGQTNPTLESKMPSKSYGQLQLAFAGHQGHLDLDVIDTCRRCASLNDLIYQSPGSVGSLSIQPNSDLSQGLHVQNMCTQVSGLLLCS